MSKIQAIDWLPPWEDTEYSDDFINWINSIIKDWDTRVQYDRFNIYREQAGEWLKDKETFEDFTRQEDLDNFRRREILRCRENSLYYLDKYHKLPEGDEVSGVIDYKAMEPQAVVAYLMDCKHSLMVVKCRQLWFTSTVCGIAVKRINFHTNYQVLYVAETETKAESLFKMKITDPFLLLPQKLKAQVYNMADGRLSLGWNPKKEKEIGHGSSITVSTPRYTSATGEAPNLELLDEIGLNKDFAKFIAEMRSTLYRYSHKTGKLSLVRQMVAWGTGKKKGTGGAVLESEYNTAKTEWDAGNFKSAIIPLFFSIKAKPGMTDEIYDREKDVAYSKTGPDAEDIRIMFHHDNPIDISDSFISGRRTFIPAIQINKHIIRVSTVHKEYWPTQYGYFQPVLNMSSPYPEHIGKKLGVAYEIIDAEWVPLGPNDPLTTTIIWRHPNREWRGRYFQGTDPINTQTGLSKFSSSIFDKLLCEPSATLNFRVRDYNQIFLQSLLMGLYYGGKDIKDLIEGNIGGMYMDYKELLGYEDTIVGQMDLPQILQTGQGQGDKRGINNKRGGLNANILHRLREYLTLYGDNINIREFWEQMKHFVETTSKTTGNTSWGPEDPIFYQTDIIFGQVFAYICATSFEQIVPVKITAVTKEDDSYITTVQNEETGWQQQKVRKRGDKIIEYLQ